MMEEIRRRQEDALQTARTLTETTKTISRTQQEATQTSALLTKVAGGTRPEETELKALGLTDTSSVFLRMRLQGLLRTKNETLAKLQTEQQQMTEMLRELGKCPACEGTGSVTQQLYIRDESTIHTQTKTEECTYCKGTGKMQLDQEIQELIESVLTTQTTKQQQDEN